MRIYAAIKSYRTKNLYNTNRAWITITSWVFYTAIKSVWSTQRRKQFYARQFARYSGDFHKNSRVAELTMRALSDRPSFLGCISVRPGYSRNLNLFSDKNTEPLQKIQVANHCISVECNARWHELLMPSSILKWSLLID